VSDPVFLGSLAFAIGAYLALWLVPEPIFSKLAAAVVTIAILSSGAFTISVLASLAKAWADLRTEAGGATSDQQIEQAAQRFGQRMGAVEADCLVFLASLLVGGRVPGPKGLPAAGKALSDAERALLAAGEGTTFGAPGFRGNVIPLRPRPTPEAPSATVAPMFEGNLALRIETAPTPAQVVPLPARPSAAAGSRPAPRTQPVPRIPVLPLPDSNPAEQGNRERPPFVLKLPRQKEPHLALYQSWLGVLQSDPAFERGRPEQRQKWLQALRLGGSHAIPFSVYERGKQLGLTEEQIRIPDWSRQRSIDMEVDHVVELQVTPDAARAHFNSMANYELLDEESNGTSGGLLAENIRKERQKQVAFDPTAATRVLFFDEVVLDGGTSGERWDVEEIRRGDHIDALEKRGR
jgi:hypothetical protein